MNHEDKVTELEGIRFPTPIKGSCTLKRVQVAPRVWDRSEDTEDTRYFYVRVYVKGRNERIACTTDEATACRFADMALWYAQRVAQLEKRLTALELRVTSAVCV
jgi:hypothetical protein